MRRLMTTALLSALLVALVGPAGARAENGLSDGCGEANAPELDAMYNGFVTSADFNAGERLTITGMEPSVGNPSTILFFASGADFDQLSTAFPGTIEYDFPTSRSYTVGWGVGHEEQATFEVSCASTAGDDQDELAVLEELVDELDVLAGIATSLASKLDEAAAALGEGDLNGACGALRAFINQTRALMGKKLSEEDAQQLIEAAEQLSESLGC